MLKNRILSVAASVAVLLAVSSPVMSARLAAADEITVGTVDELKRFSEKCTLDTWSQDKKVVLTADIDLAGGTFPPIATFGGTFDGNGHTVSGINIDGAGSNIGLFRYIQSGATVKNLNAEGSISPKGSKSAVGGIAGRNSGDIINCSFSGTVSGDISTGGIVGINEENGRVAGCASDANVTGTRFTGGIAGKNLGTLMKCTGNGTVNITAREATVDFEDINISSTLEQLKTSADSTDSAVAGHTDTGGVVGYSSGIVQSCKHTGIVGYKHVGYNVGGIAGRQAGYLNNCVNTGEVYGRKDVGGIVGQMEPYIIADLSEDTLKELDKELDTLTAMIDNALNDAENSSSTISSRLEIIRGYADDAKDSANKLSDKTTSFVDNNVDEINRIGDIVAGVVDRTVPITDDMQTISSKTEEAIAKTDKILDALQDVSAENTKAVEKGKLAIDELDKANVYVGNAIDDISQSLTQLENALVIKDEDAVNQALKDLADGVKNLGEAMSAESDAMAELEEALSEVTDWGDISGSSEAISEALGKLSDATGQMSDATTKIGDALAVISDNVEINQDELDEALSYLDDAMGELQEASEYFGNAASYLNEAMDYVKKASEKLNDTLGLTKELNEKIGEISSVTTSAISKLKDLTKELSDEEPIEFSKLGDDYRQESERLNAALTNMSSQLSELNNEAYSASQTLSEDLRTVNTQMNKVSDLILTEVSAFSDSDASIFEDMSDVDVGGTKLGKVSDCKNTGTVNGDRNVGGTTGSMAIDYDLDPEDDVTGNFSKNTTYETKAVMQGCVNSGKIMSKKDCAGGLVGRMDLGTVIVCENYGDVESTGGDYVGGIAGLSLSNIRTSFSKCELLGRNYVGGIVGNGKKISDCGAITHITADELRGAIAGYADIDRENIYGNKYLDTGTSGIDEISYSGIAEPVGFSDLSAMKCVPSTFLKFRLKLVADDISAGEVTFNYGENLDGISLPEVPMKDGYYGEWADFDRSGKTSDITVNAVYKPWITVIESEETSENGLACALIDGKFTDKCSLKYSVSKCDSVRGTLPEKAIGLDVYNISLDKSEATEAVEMTSVRLLNTSGNDKVSVFGFDGKDWCEASYKVNGQYLIISEPDSFGSYIIIPDGINTVLIALICAAAVVLAAAALVIFRKKQK